MTTFVSNAALVIFWYASNILVVLSNKYLLTEYGFRYPIFLTGCHMLACGVMGYSAFLTQIVARQRIQSGKQLGKIVVLACVFCAAVVLGNISLKYIPVSFNQAVGATTPFFTAIICFCCLGQRETLLVYCSLMPVVIGIVVSSGGEPLFHVYGFAAAIAATFGRAFKSVLQGILLADNAERMNSMNLLLYMSPIATLALVPFIIIAEPNVLEVVTATAKVDHWFIPALILNASLAFFVNLSNFMVTKHTSALTLQVLGNAKGIVAAIISVLIFKNPVTVQGGVGYLITMAGVAWYSQAKGRASQAAERTIEVGKESKSLPPIPVDDVESQKGLASPLLGDKQTIPAFRSPIKT